MCQYVLQHILIARFANNTLQFGAKGQRYKKRHIKKIDTPHFLRICQ